MSSDQYRPSTKSTRAPVRPDSHSTLDILQSHIPINPSLPQSTCIIKDLRYVNLLEEINLSENQQIHVQETVEILPQPVSCERIFYSYIDDHTNLRSKEFIHTMPKSSDQEFQFDLFSTTLYIFPKQRNEKFISEIRYIPEHVTIRYKTTLELLSATLTSPSSEQIYENIQDFYHLVRDIFYRI